MAKKIYIAGPMRGHKFFNFPAFDSAETALTTEGWIVLSPANLDRNNGFNELEMPVDWDWSEVPDYFNLQDAIKRDIHALEQCEAIYMLKGWEGSKGARAEKALAEWMGKEILYQEPEALRDGLTIENSAGGKQSFISARFDCIPWVVLRLLAQCLGFGARKYGVDNWRLIPPEEHLGHAANHINEWRAGDRSEPHLPNAIARMFFALTQTIEAGEQAERYQHPDERIVRNG